MIGAVVRWMPTGQGRVALLVGVGGLVVVVAALASAIVFAIYEVAVWRDLPAMALACAAGAAALAAVVVVAAIARTRPTAALVAAGGLYVAIAGVTALAIDGPLIEDAQAFHRLALGWTLGAPPISDRPMGWPIVLGEAYRWLGASPGTAELLNFLIRTIGVAMVAAWVGLVGGRQAAAIAVAVIAVSPTQALYAVTLMSETLYTTLLIATILLVTLALRSLEADSERRRAILIAFAAGLVLGSSVYVRTTSLAVAPFLALLPLLQHEKRRATAVALAVVVGFVAMLGPAVIANKAYVDRWSASTSLHVGWQLFVGVNVETAGRWSASDFALVNARLGRDSPAIPWRYAHGHFDPAALRLFAERDELAFGMALERIGRDAIRLPLIVPFKFAYGWGPGDPWAADADDPERSFDLGTGRTRDERREGLALGGTIQRAASFVAQAWWIAVLAGALAWFAWRWRNDPTTALVLSAVLIPLTLGLLALQSSARYHEYVVPLIAGLAAIALLTAIRARSRESPSSAPGEPARDAR